MTNEELRNALIENEIVKIKDRRTTIRFESAFKEFGIGSYFDLHVWFRDDREDLKLSHCNDDTILFTIDHEEHGIIGVSFNQLIDYLYRNRKRINSWIDSILNEKESNYFLLESETAFC